MAEDTATKALIKALKDKLPYERDIYMTMLTKWVEEETERIKQQNQSR